MNAKLSATWSNSSKVLHCVLEDEWLKSSPDVVIEGSHILISRDDEKCTFLLPGIALHPESCRGLKLANTELHFSIRGTLSSDESEVSNRKIVSVQNDRVDKIERLQNKWFCAVCKQKLLADWSLFSRVLPLPSENWADFADMWFCHNHGNQNGSKQKQAGFLPNDRECFVGETYVLVARQHVSSASVKVTKLDAVMCKRCGIQLGEMAGHKNGLSRHNGVIKFFIHTLLIENLTATELIQPDRSCVNRIDLNSFFSGLLIEQSTTYASYRFIIESQLPIGIGDTLDRSSTCLVWLLDSSVQMFRSDLESQSAVHKNGITQAVVKQTEATKVMFKCQLCASNTNRSADYVTKSVISLWKKDNTVHGFKLPHPIFLQLVGLLVKNCKSLPPSQRYLNGFHVSYIQNDAVT